MQYHLSKNNIKQKLKKVTGLPDFEYDGIHRVTLMIDEKGNIEKIFKKVNIQERSEQVPEKM